MILEVKNLDVFYGSIHALHGISFEVNKGEIVTLIGSNGAGKTTTLRSISALNRVQGGEVIYRRQADHQPEAAPDRQDGYLPRARGAQDHRQPDGAGKLDDGRLYPQRQGGHPGVPGGGLHPLSEAQGKSETIRAPPSPAASSRCWPSGAA